MATIKPALLEEVARSAHTFWEKKLTPGMDSGDTSLRDPETGLIYILPQPSERQPIRGWNTITSADVAVIDQQGNVVGPPENLPTIEAPMHLRIYEARPDVNAIVHSHGVWSQIFAAVRQDIPCLTMDAYHFLMGEVKCAEFGRVASETLAQNIVEALGNDHKAALMAGHGAACVGADFYEAFLVAEVLETTAKQALFAKLIGKIVPVTLGDILPEDMIKAMDPETLKQLNIKF
jgi:L-fuculose-phosphate aldolase